MNKPILGLLMLTLLFTHGLSAQSTQPSYPKSRVLMQEDFDGKATTQFRSRLIKGKLCKIAKDSGPDGSDALRVTYEGYERGSKRVVIREKFKKSVKEATLIFDVYFEPGFQFTYGGKLHGLGPSKPITGGGVMKPEGWSARSMFKEEGKISAYLYKQNKDSKWGVGKKTEKPAFTPGQWHRVMIHVKVNSTPETADGFADYYIDGKRVISEQGAQFRAKGGKATLINQFLFSTFHGGNKPKWAPKDKDGNYTKVFARFDDFLVIEGAPLPSSSVKERK